MEYLIEAKKFIQRAKNDENEEVRSTDLDMAEWLLTRAIEELEEMPGQASRRAAPAKAVLIRALLVQANYLDNSNTRVLAIRSRCPLGMPVSCGPDPSGPMC